MHHFSPHDYGPSVAALLTAAPEMPLTAGAPNQSVRAALADLAPENLFTHAKLRIVSDAMARACLAGLWLRHNFLDESHVFSQDIATPTGSFWHAILHRREPDYGNARYWFRQVGEHPVFFALAAAASDAGWTKSVRWDPVAFVGAVQDACRTGDARQVELCRRVQQIEWELLFDYSWRQTFNA